MLPWINTSQVQQIVGVGSVGTPFIGLPVLVGVTTARSEVLPKAHEVPTMLWLGPAGESRHM
jgi:hypothetical protein